VKEATGDASAGKVSGNDFPANCVVVEENS